MPAPTYEDTYAEISSIPLFGKAKAESIAKKTQAEREAAYKQSPGFLEEQLLASLQSSPTYTPPEEVAQLQELLTSRGQQIEDIAEMRTGMAEAPGAGIQREQIRQMTESAAQDIIETGGASASALGAIAQTRASELSSLRDLAVQGQQYRDQARRDYMQALGESAGLQATGLQSTIGQKEKVFESELDKLRNIQQFQMGQIGNLYTQRMAQKQIDEARAASQRGVWGDVLGSVIGIANPAGWAGLFGGGAEK